MRQTVSAQYPSRTSNKGVKMEDFDTVELPPSLSLLPIPWMTDTDDDAMMMVGGSSAGRPLLLCYRYTHGWLLAGPSNPPSPARTIDLNSGVRARSGLGASKQRHQATRKIGGESHDGLGLL